jgi:tetratricopeptide (TPR) repeat protein
MTAPAHVAFISYAHADMRHAQRLQRSLEHYRLPPGVPHPLAGARGRRLAPIFRDVSDLASAPSLTAAIREALAASGALIVVCSPAAAASGWVDAEVRFYLDTHAGGRERIFCAIVDGPPDAEFSALIPPTLREGGEPLAADLRPGTRGTSHGLPKLVAGLVSAPLDVLLQRARVQTRRLRLAAATGVLLVATAVGGSLWWGREQAADARSYNERASSLIEFVITDLKRRLERYDSVGDVGPAAEETLAYFDSLRPLGMTDENLARYRDALQLAGDLRIRQGDYGAALSVYQESADVSSTLAQHRGDARSWFDFGVAETAVGSGYWELGDVAAAAEYIEGAMPHYDRAAQLGADVFEFQHEYIVGLNNLGAVYTRLRQYERARERLRNALERIDGLEGRTWDDEDAAAKLLNQRAEAVSWLTEITQLLGEFEAAARWHEIEIGIRRHQLSETGNPLVEQRLGDALEFVVKTTVATRDYAAATRSATEALAIFERLCDEDPDNLFWRHRLYRAQFMMANLELFSGDGTDAKALLDAAAAGFDAMLAEQPDQLPWRADRWAVDLVRATRQWWRGDSTGAAALALPVLRQSAEYTEAEVANAKALEAYLHAAVLTAVTSRGEERAGTARDALTVLEAKGNATYSVFDGAYRAVLLRASGREAEAQSTWAKVTATGYRHPFLSRAFESL